jgi:hypothetical protein
MWRAWTRWRKKNFMNEWMKWEKILIEYWGAIHSQYDLLKKLLKKTNASRVENIRICIHIYILTVLALVWLENSVYVGKAQER